MIIPIVHRRKLKGSEKLCDLPWVMHLRRDGTRLQTRTSLPQSLNHGANLPPQTYGKRRGEFWARERHTQNGGKNTSRAHKVFDKYQEKNRKK